MGLFKFTRRADKGSILTSAEVDANFDGLYDGSPNILPNSSGNLGQNAWGSYNFAPTWSSSGAGSYFANAASLSAATSDVSDAIVIGAAMPIALQARVDAAGVTGGTVVLNVEAFDASDASLGIVCALTVTNGSDNGKLTASGTTPANTASVKINKGVSGSAVVSAAGLKFRRIKVEQGLYCGPWTDEASGTWIQTNSALCTDCRLTYTSATVLTLVRFAGSKLAINGVNRTIPSSGVTLSSTGLGAGTLQYVYAYMSGSSMTLEASTTAYATDANTGLPIKSGDPTRTLVGMAYIATAATFVDVYNNRLVASYFNRRNRIAQGSGVTTYSGTTAGLIGGTALNILKWRDEALTQLVTGSTQSNTANSVSRVDPYMNGAVSPSYSVARNDNINANTLNSFAASGFFFAESNVEGMVTGQLYGVTNSGATMTIYYTQSLTTSI